MKNENDLSQTKWDPLKIFECSVDHKFAVIILNQPIHLNHDHVLPLWEKAQITITVDGGTNRWMEYLENRVGDMLTERCKAYLPNLIVGDLDSISPDLLEKLKYTDINIIYTPDQMETDYTKALIQLKKYMDKDNIKLNGIYVFVEAAGRFDQIIANINTLHKCDKIVDNVPVIHIASDSLTWLLNSGSHKIKIPDNLLKSKSWCALIPFSSTNNCISTTGLKWNLNKTCMKIGELISTSNTYDGQPEVTVDTNVPLIWSMEIKFFKNSDKS